MKTESKRVKREVRVLIVENLHCNHDLLLGMFPSAHQDRLQEETGLLALVFSGRNGSARSSVFHLILLLTNSSKQPTTSKRLENRHKKLTKRKELKGKT